MNKLKKYMKSAYRSKMDERTLDKQKTGYIVVYWKGKPWVTPKGKSSWPSVGAAKNAVRYYLDELSWLTRQAVQKAMEDIEETYSSADYNTLKDEVFKELYKEIEFREIHEESNV